MKGVILKQNKEMSKNYFTVYHKPKWIYIPLIVGNDTDITVLVKKDDYVCKGEIVARRKGPLSIPLFASVSGTVVAFEEKLHHSGHYVKCIKIENDFKERMEEKTENNEITKYTKEEFIENLKNAGIVGMGGAGFPTYIKYQTEQPIHTLIVNAVECEPYITADYTIGVQKSLEILETIDAILEINHIQKAIIAVKKNNKELLQALQTRVGTYVNIKIVEVPNSYPMGWEKNLVQYITKRTYHKLPNEIGVVVNNISTIYAIYQALKNKMPLIERVITITGDMVKQPTNVHVKIGTPAHEVIEKIGGLKRAKDILCIAGGPMMGVTLPSDDVIITADMNALVILRKQEDLMEQTCMHCGKCVEVCPARIEPVFIKESCLNQEALQKLRVNQCVECGLCSYICPAKIKVREYVKKAKETLRKGVSS